MRNEFDYKVNGEEWKEACDKAFEKLNKKAKIDGFRPGKAPRSVFEKKYGKGDIYNEAADKMIQKKYMSILTEEKIIPVVEPSVNLVNVNDDELEVKFVFITKPEVKLGEYKGLKVKKDKVSVSKEEIEHEIKHLCEDYAEIVSKDGKVENGDITIIDFEGFKDGVPFDGGKGTNYQLEIGSHSFIPGFEEGMIGMEKDSEKDLELSFPEDYHVEDLKGQKVVFKVKVNDIKSKVIPEMDKDFFEDLNMEGIDSKEKLEEQVKKEIKERKEQTVEDKFVEDLLEKASSNMEVSIDDEIVHTEAHNMYHSFMERMSMQGINEELYLQYSGTTHDEMISKMEPEALKRVKYGYLLEAIVKAEDIKASDSDVEAKIEEIAKQYNVDKENVLSQLNINKDDLKYNIEMEKAIEVLKENN